MKRRGPKQRGMRNHRPPPIDTDLANKYKDKKYKDKTPQDDHAQYRIFPGKHKGPDRDDDPPAYCLQIPNAIGCHR